MHMEVFWYQKVEGLVKLRWYLTADMSSLVHIDIKKKDISILSKGLTYFR